MDILKARQELIQGKTIYDMPLRVVDYGRVSTDKDEQMNSLENQAHYFQDMIGNVKNWKHVASYRDEGISGTQVWKREQFLKMIDEARLGKIDMIVTKEVSRFARNTIDSIQYTQLLLQYGVIVFFISDNINTIYPDSEFRLTLMASMAQDEVRKLSERVKFGIRRSIQDRKVGGGGLYGYDKKDCQLTINHQEAPGVKLLFTLYASGEYGFKKIGEKLKAAGYVTRKGKTFSDTTLKKMLTNPRYKGWYTANMSEVEDYKTHKKKKKPKEEWISYKDETGHVPAIVEEELWNRANQIHEERLARWNKNVLNKEFYLENRSYTSKLICVEHQAHFVRTASGKRKANPVWQCNLYLRHGKKACETPILKEQVLDCIFKEILEPVLEKKEEFLKLILQDYQHLYQEVKTQVTKTTYLEKMCNKKKAQARLLDAYVRGMIEDADFIEKKQQLTSEIEHLQKTYSSQASSSSFHSNLIAIQNYLKDALTIEKHIGTYFHLFVRQVLIRKMEEDRKRLHLQIFFQFQKEPKEVLVDLHDKEPSYFFLF